MTRNRSPIMDLCRGCVKLCKWFPVLFIVTVAVWSYYAYVIQLCIFIVQNVLEKIVYLILYHVCLILFAWSYWQTIFANIGLVPRQFKLSPTEVERLEKEVTEDGQDTILNQFASDLPILNRTLRGGIRYCEKCRHVKPDRAHHCSVCGKCVLKMDHHCPWVNNCVSFTNYKYFILFLGYSLLYCLYIAISSLYYFIKFWKSELKEVGTGRFHILFLFFVAAMFAISLVSLFGYHCYLVTVNRSTLESFRAPIFRMGPDKNGFNLGKYPNFVQIFGEVKWKWFLPMETHIGDGVSYPTKSQHTSTYETMGHTAAPQTSQGDGTSFPERKVGAEEHSLINEKPGWNECRIDMDDNNRDAADPEPPSSTSSDVKLIVE